MGNGRQIGADLVAHASQGVTLRADPLEGCPTTFCIASGRYFLQPILNYRFAITVFFVADPLGGPRLDFRSALAQETATLFQIQREFTQFDLPGFNGGHQDVVEGNALKQEINRGWANWRSKTFPMLH